LHSKLSHESLLMPGEKEKKSTATGRVGVQCSYSTPQAFSNALQILLHTTAPLSGYSLTLIASSVYVASTLPCASAPVQRLRHEQQWPGDDEVPMTMQTGLPSLAMLGT
jgi:hypothetical protein